MLLTFPILPLVLVSCVGPVQYSAKNEAFLRQQSAMQPWKRIAVLPFAGDPAFARTSAEWLAYLIGKQQLFEITPPAIAESEMGLRGLRSGEGEIDLETARIAGKDLGVDGVIVGSIRTSLVDLQRLQWEKKTVAVSIVAVATGEVVATSVHEGASAIPLTEAVVNDFLPVLYPVAGREWAPPPKEEPDQKMPWSGQ
jgi:hypothetical protein